MKDILKRTRRFRSKLESKEKIKDYMESSNLNIEKLINEYYAYVYTIVRNLRSISLSNEDMEEIISDTFFAIWKNSKKLEEDVYIKPYLAGTAKNIIKNKYRTTHIDFSIADYEEKIIDIASLQKITEENEQNEIIRKTLKEMKKEEYEVFMMFYYEALKIKEIAKTLSITESKVKVILHRVRKKIKRNLENGGYGYGK